MHSDEVFLELLASLQQLVPVVVESGISDDYTTEELEDLFVDPQQESLQPQYQIPIELIESGWIERDDLITALDLVIFQRGIVPPRSFSSVPDISGVSIQFPKLQGQ